MSRICLPLTGLVLLAAISVPAESEEVETGKAASEKEAAGKYAKGCLEAGCHADVVKYEVVHGPVAVAACDACHKAEEGEEHSFELAREEEELCTFCHAQPKPAAVVHTPFEQKVCLGCHDPHGGSKRAFLMETEEPGGLCLECHMDAPAFHDVSRTRYQRCQTCHVAVHGSNRDPALFNE